MLSVADADIVRRDPEIPGLATLLDSQLFAGELQAAFPETPLTVVRARYARYKPGLSCLVAYIVQLDGRQIAVYAKAFSRSTQEKLEKSGIWMHARGPLTTGGTVLGRLGVAIHVYPNDRALRQLPRIADPEKRSKLISRLLPGRPDLWHEEMYELRYKPERRYVARLGRSGAVLRAYNEGDYRRANTTVNAFASREHLRVASLLGKSDRRRTLVVDWLDGQPLDEVWEDSDFDLARVQQVAAALSELHAQSPDALGASEPAKPERRLAAAADALALICPDLAGRARGLASQLAPRLAASARTGPIHGDFSADQVLLRDDGVGVIDFDAAGRGEPAADLASFAAHVQREVVRGNLEERRAEALIAELLTGYGCASGDHLGGRFEPHFAAALLSLACSPFRYREEDWQLNARGLLERAEEVAFHG